MDRATGPSPIVKQATTFTNVPLQRLVSRLIGVENLKYLPLQPGEIRILCLKPGKYGTDLHCRLKHIRLDALGKETKRSFWRTLGLLFRKGLRYEAISYAWGNPVFDHFLHIDGHGRKPITRSLWEALQHLRHGHRRRMLWADAVCVDQSTKGEVEEQVKVFSEIYRCADAALVWLGAAEKKDLVAFATLASLSEDRLLRLNPENYDLARLTRCLSQPKHCHCCRASAGTQGEDAEECIRATISLLGRGYFTRMWVLQEVLSATRVKLCAGLHQTSWSNFLSMLGAMHNIVLHGDDTTSELCRTLQSWAPQMSDLAAIHLPRRDMKRSRGRFSVSNVLEVMTSFSSFGCSDPRDRVYAVRQILQVKHLTQLDPDYTLPPTEVFRRLVCACVSQRGPWCKNYEFLALVGTEGSRAGGPSWVPNFHSLSERSRYKHRQYSYIAYADTTPIRSSPLDFVAEVSSSNSNHLRVRGRIIGTIQQIRPECRWPSDTDLDSEDRETSTSVLCEWYRRCRDHSKAAILEHSRDRDLLAFLTWGYSRLDCESEQNAEAVNDNSESNCPLQKHFLDLNDDTRDEATAALSFLWQKAIEQRAQRTLHGMHVLVDPSHIFAHVTTDTGDILAWVPPTTMCGDRLAVVSGSPLPFVLRDGLQRNELELLGDAYVSSLTARHVFGGKFDKAFVWSSPPAKFADWNYRQIVDLQQRENMRELIEGLGWITLG